MHLVRSILKVIVAFIPSFLSFWLFVIFSMLFSMSAFVYSIYLVSIIIILISFKWRINIVILSNSIISILTLIYIIVIISVNFFLLDIFHPHSMHFSISQRNIIISVIFESILYAFVFLSFLFGFRFRIYYPKNWTIEFKITQIFIRRNNYLMVS